MHSSRAGLSIATGHTSHVGSPKWAVSSNTEAEWGSRTVPYGKAEVQGLGDEGTNPCNFVVTTNCASFKLSTSGFDLLYWC